MYELSNFDAIQIGIASPEKVREWSYGEVTKPETINYRTQKPEKDGLFCERIFGPTRDWECHCGRYKRVRYKGVICEKCGVEVTKAKVRRERMGHIELACPVTHIWYLRGVPSRISILLDISPKELEQVVYFVSYIVLDPGPTGLSKKQVISDKEYRDLLEKYDSKEFKVAMGAEAVKELLMEVDLDKESEQLKLVIANSVGQKRLKAVKRLEIVEAFRRSGNKPEWMVLDVIPVLPPELRPMVQLDGGRYATSDLNDLYRRVINRNNRLKKLKELGAPEIIVHNEKRMLQEAVDALIDNGRRGKAVSGAGNRDLKSLTGMLRGKQGRFRQNLLGKRVDYSGRSVIVVGPELKLYQCGLPKEMALELFKPFIMNKLVERNLCHNIKSAKRFVDTGKNQVWDILEEIIKDHPVLLNRAPTLHRLGIQAFEPVLVEGRAIKLHPLACGAFNADFDGDQMAVHVPLSIEAQAEARILMLCTNNILKLSDGKPIVSPTQDMVIGSYYLTIVHPGEKGEGNYYSSFDEATMAYQEKALTLQSLCYIRVPVHNADGTVSTKLLHTTLGRCIFNANIPQDLQFVDRDDAEQKGQLEVEGILGINACIDENQFHSVVELFRASKQADAYACARTILKRKDLTDAQIDKIANIVKEAGDLDLTKVKEFNREITTLRNAIQKVLGQKAIAIGKKQLSMIVDNCFKYHGATETAEMLDKIKALGYKYSTIGAITASVFDMHIPGDKKKIVADAEAQVVKIEKLHARGVFSDEGRYKEIIKIWKDASDKVEEELKKGLDDFNPIWMMANSGARGSMGQIRQLAGMRGLMADPSGRTIELPVRASFREGLSVLEYFISSHGGRKGLADTALKTADSGYLTRRLVDVSHSVIVREHDCGDTKGTFITAIRDEKSVIEALADRIAGRYTVDPVVNPETGEVLCEAGELISADLAKEIDKVLTSHWEKNGADMHNQPGVLIRSILTCKTRNGVCVKCYGKNMASGNPVKIGEAVGIIAAQSIGEPGTQLTMRTFHSGGVATDDDITQGLPRVEELFEARNPKGKAVITENNGIVHISDDRREITVAGDGEVKAYAIPYNANILVAEGEEIGAGDALTKGSINPQDMLRAKGVKGVQEYIAKEVQSAYRTAGVEINDKHVEVIVRQMLRKVRIENQGDTDMLPGTLVDLFAYEDENEKVLENGGVPATAKRTLLGITKAALATESFLSAASFQETAKVLAEAAINNKIDPLVGLKENVIIGKLIPAGTGMKCYKNIVPVQAVEADEEVRREEALDIAVGLDNMFDDGLED
ncbi:MAG: DNA-directed RNA polymerase subunit beta' [Firmicutes bacterium]|nr:DNA-directed RNA polymerase subunit beta' [Bacillota bacterium]MCM1393534.1 DNA-directed RNA polymerase subunit beta' [[Eubacterium] siraeum]